MTSRGLGRPRLARLKPACDGAHPCHATVVLTWPAWQAYPRAGGYLGVPHFCMSLIQLNNNNNSNKRFFFKEYQLQ